MNTFSFAELSATAGVDGDGVQKGRVIPSQLVGGYVKADTSVGVRVFRKDRAGMASTFTDLTEEAHTADPNSLVLFGTDGTITEDDSSYISCPHKVAAVWLQLDTPAVWDGEGIEVFYSNDGITANTPVPNLVDPTNGFRNEAGLYRVSWDVPDDVEAFSPIPADIPIMNWFVCKFKGVTSMTTAPLFSRVWAQHSPEAPHYFYNRDEAYGGLTADDDFGELADIEGFYTGDSSQNLIFPFLAYGLDITTHRAIEAVVDGVAEYLADDGTWKELQDFSDTSAGYHNGPVALGDPVENFSMRWAIPDDWSERTESFLLEEGGPTESKTGYHFRYRMTSIVPTGPSHFGLLRLRVKAFGDDNSYGVYHKEAASYSAITYDVSVPPDTDCHAQVVNLSTGKAGAFTIHTNVYSSGELIDTQHWVVDPPLKVAAGESILFTHVGGGTCSDVELKLQ